MERETLEKDILRLLEQQPGISAKEIADQLSVSEDMVTKSIESLSDTRQKVLIVDDEPDAVIATKRALEADGYNVIEANNGVMAFDVLKSDIPDVILLDVMMPDMDGFEVCRRLKEEPLYENIPVIMLTAKGEINDKIEGLDIGADDYMTKPFNLKELKARIKTVLRRTQD
ncbi:response regulator [Methanococcoides seepicolus]|jgi:two-component system alkaline phosphatase synthesis response regulator PhoP|uniref:Response regulator n=1 Tax=Methanococcoides seepicolus TaxID=2828780 RepID=A0A9E4ZF02_9EURY|nr:response regulator [Methanococcoides seepicolus]MCM1986871.1 response regulator [Methanococcoides seepicolus]